jgi:threonine synthase
MSLVGCSNCKRPYPESGMPYRCQTCGSLYDYLEWPDFNPVDVDPTQTGIWKYRLALGLPEDAPKTSLGEGNTPLVWGEVNGKSVAFKCEYQNPSGSFKDRGVAPMISMLLSRGVKEAIEDSSGNAGAAFAAYAAHFGLKARIYIPDSASGPKRRQIELYGSDIIGIPGSRSNASEAVRKDADNGKIYASHAYLPFNLPGYATIAYELMEQLGEVPGTVFVPVGQGGLILGIGRGFYTLLRRGLIQKMPVFIGVQASSCAPIWALHAYGPAGLGFVSEGETVAEGIRVRYPLRGDAVVQFVEQHGGKFIAVDDVAIISGRDQLARQGFYVEMTSGIVWGAIEQNIGKTPEPFVAVLTGSGLKTAPG